MTTRREFIKRGTATASVLAFGGVLTSCSPKNLSGWVTTIVSTFGEIKPLLPQLGLGQIVLDRVSGYLDKAVSIAKSFDEAYRKGDFKNALTLFGSLSGLITSIATELNGVDNRIVKLALISISIARIAIASLLKQQSNQPAVAAEISRTAKGTETLKAANEVERLAAVNIDALLKAVQ